MRRRTENRTGVSGRRSGAQRAIIGKGRRGGVFRLGAVQVRVRQSSSNCHTFLHWMRRTAAGAGRDGGMVLALLRAQHAQDVSLPLACPVRPPIRTAVGIWERVGWGDTQDLSLLRGSPRHRHTPNTTTRASIPLLIIQVKRKKLYTDKKT